MNWGPEGLGNWPKVTKRTARIWSISSILDLPPYDYSMSQTITVPALLLCSAASTPTYNGRELTQLCTYYLQGTVPGNVITLPQLPSGVDRMNPQKRNSCTCSNSHPPCCPHLPSSQVAEPRCEYLPLKPILIVELYYYLGNGWI